jgi:histidine triad (HIT) family protein
VRQASQSFKELGMEGHRVVLSFDGGGSPRLKLLHPESGCAPATQCALCGRMEGSESAPCYDCKGGFDPSCWLTDWFDNLSADELLHGSVTVAVTAEWDQDHPKIIIESPELDVSTLPASESPGNSGEVEEECPFCDYEGPSKILHDFGDVIVIEPLQPVTPGHLLVIPKAHVPSFAPSPPTTAVVMQRAAEWVATKGGDWNLITSKGEAATQTVGHLHVHLVPRSKGDGLALPWAASPQAEVEDCDDLCTCGHERFHHDDGREMGVETNCKARRNGNPCTCKQFDLVDDEEVVQQSPAEQQGDVVEVLAEWLYREERAA